MQAVKTDLEAPEFELFLKNQAGLLTLTPASYSIERGNGTIHIYLKLTKSARLKRLKSYFPHNSELNFERIGNNNTNDPEGAENSRLRVAIVRTREIYESTRKEAEEKISPTNCCKAILSPGEFQSLCDSFAGLLMLSPQSWSFTRKDHKVEVLLCFLMADEVQNYEILFFPQGCHRFQAIPSFEESPLQETDELKKSINEAYQTYTEKKKPGKPRGGQRKDLEKTVHRAENADQHVEIEEEKRNETNIKTINVSEIRLKDEEESHGYDEKNVNEDCFLQKNESIVENETHKKKVRNIKKALIIEDSHFKQSLEKKFLGVASGIGESSSKKIIKRKAEDLEIQEQFGEKVKENNLSLFKKKQEPQIHQEPWTYYPKNYFEPVKLVRSRAFESLSEISAKKIL